jgi:hypothetical protein
MVYGHWIDPLSGVVPRVLGTTLASGVPLSVPALNSPAQRSGAAKSEEEAEGQKAQRCARECAGDQATGLRASGHVGLIREDAALSKRGYKWPAILVLVGRYGLSTSWPDLFRPSPQHGAAMDGRNKSAMTM